MSLRVHSIIRPMATAYLIESKDSLILVDAGMVGDERHVLSHIRALGQDETNLQLIFVTHAHLDHYGSAGALRRLTGAPIAVHHADGDVMAQGKTVLGSVRSRGKLTKMLLPLIESLARPDPTPPDILLKNGDRLRAHGIDAFDAMVLHAPGHTPGSSCLVVETDPGERIAFVGDLLSATGRPHAQRYFAHDWSLIPKSIARLQALNPEQVYAGHGRRPVGRDQLRWLALES